MDPWTRSSIDPPRFDRFGWRRNRRGPLPSPFRTSVRCTRRRKGVSRARPTLLPLGRASVPLLWYPSYDPGFRVSRAAPGGERPRLTQTQNRSPFVALLATPSPAHPPKEARHTRGYSSSAVSWKGEEKMEKRRRGETFLSFFRDGETTPSSRG